MRFTLLFAIILCAFASCHSADIEIVQVRGEGLTVAQSGGAFCSFELTNKGNRLESLVTIQGAIYDSEGGLQAVSKEQLFNQDQFLPNKPKNFMLYFENGVSNHLGEEMPWDEEGGLDFVKDHEVIVTIESYDFSPLEFSFFPFREE